MLGEHSLEIAASLKRKQGKAVSFLTTILPYISLPHYEMRMACIQNYGIIWSAFFWCLQTV